MISNAKKNRAKKSISNINNSPETKNVNEIKNNLLIQKKSKIDSIEYIQNDDFLPDLIKKIEDNNTKKIDELIKYKSLHNIKTDKNIPGKDKIILDKFPEISEKPASTNLDNIQKNPNKIDLDNIKNKDNLKHHKKTEVKKINNDNLKEKNKLKQDPDDKTEELKNQQEDIEELEFLDEEIEELTSIEEEEDNITDLIDNIDLENDKIKYPGKIDINKIDKNLIEKDIKEKKKDHQDVEAFGINRVEVFYNIDKKIYSSRSKRTYGKNKISNVKRGLLLPVSIASSLLTLIPIFLIPWLIFINFKSKSNLEDNIINDNSILSKINQRQMEEARLEKLKLEEERKLLEQEKKMLETTLEEQLKKREEEIEAQYLVKLQELEEKKISDNEKERLLQKLEEEKANAIKLAKLEIDKQLEDQKNALEEKGKELEIKIADVEETRRMYESEIIKIRKEEEKTKEKLDKIQQFNVTIYKLISGSMDDFKKGNYDRALIKLRLVLDFYVEQEDFVNANLELITKRDTDIFFVQTIAKLIEEAKGSYKLDDKFKLILDKFEKLTSYYKKAEIYYNEKKFSQSGKEYEKVLVEFKEINSSYEKLLEIKKREQNETALKYYTSALKKIDQKEYESALDDLKNIIKVTPLSNYTNQALNQIVLLSGSLNKSEQIDKQNEKAKILYDNAEKLKNSGDYNNALLFYHKIITEYPQSDYTIKAIEESKIISNILKNESLKDYEQILKSKFEKDYNRYRYYYEKGDIENARIFYFEALRKAFDIYTGNTISDFKLAEDQYIETLLEEMANKYKLSEEERKTVNDLEIEKKELEEKYNKLLAEKTSNELINRYKNEIESKNQEIKDLKKIIEEKEKITSNSEIEKLLNEYKEQLKTEKEKYDVLKQQLYVYYQKENEYNKEKENLLKLEKELNDLKEKYKELETKYNEKAISEKDKEELEKELRLTLEKQYELEKQREIEKEKEKIRNEYEILLEKLKKQFLYYYDEDYEKYIEEYKKSKNQIFAQVTDIVNESIAFQFIALDPASKIKVNIGDKVQIIRLTIVNNKRKEIVIGYLTVTSVREGSLYGRGYIQSLVKGYDIKVGDLLKN